MDDLEAENLDELRDEVEEMLAEADEEKPVKKPRKPRSKTPETKVVVAKRGRKPKTAYEKGTEKPSKAGKAAHSAEAEQKRQLTNQMKKAVATAVKGEIMNAIRESLTAIDPSTKKAWFERFLQTYMNDAIKNPNGRPAQLLASNLFQADILTKLDTEAEKLMARDLAFARYRLHSTLFRQQKQVIEDTISKFIAVICSRRAGKTENNARLLVDRSLVPNSPLLYINLTFGNAVAQVYDLIMKAVDAISLPVEHASKNDGEIYFTNGSSIKLRGNSSIAEREKIQGFKYRTVIIDEIQSQKGIRYLVDDMLTPAMSDFVDSQLIVTGTPPRIPKTWIEDVWLSHNGWQKYHWTAADNPFMPNWENTIKEICEKKGYSIDSPFIQREFYGIVGAYDIEAQVYRNYKTYKGNIPGDFIPTDCVIGVDYGFEDDNAIIPLLYDRNKRIGYVLNGQERKFNHATVGEIVKAVKEVMEECKKFLLERCGNNADFSRIRILTDCNEKSISYEMNVTHGLPAYMAYKYDKAYGISYLAECVRGEGGAVIYVPEDGVCADEMERTVYKRDDQDKILTEIDDELFHPNAMDALLYASRQFAFDCGADSGGEASRI